MKNIFNGKLNKEPYELIISMVSLFVACGAIFQTCSSLEMQRIHNEKSVKPIASFQFSNYENKIGFYILDILNTNFLYSRA